MTLRLERAIDNIVSLLPGWAQGNARTVLHEFALALIEACSK